MKAGGQINKSPHRQVRLLQIQAGNTSEFRERDTEIQGGVYPTLWTSLLEFLDSRESEEKTAQTRVGTSHAHTSHQPHLPSSHLALTQRPAVEDTALQGFLPGPTFHIRLTYTKEGGVAQCHEEQPYFLHTSAVIIHLSPLLPAKGICTSLN